MGAGKSGARAPVGVAPRVKSAVKTALRHAGMDLDLAARLGIKRVRKNDIFIVSYPKSGNTWIRFLLANALCPDRVATFHDLDDFVPDVHAHRDQINGMRAGRLIKSHFACCSQYPRFVYICRDGRDVMVSFYHFSRQLGQFNGSFSEFIRSRRTKVFGRWRWHQHVGAALEERRRRPKQVLFVRYEDLLADPFGSASKILQFCRVKASESQVSDAVARCSFDNLRAIEESYGGAGKARRFMRKGTSNQWPQYFMPGDVAYFHEQAGDVLKRAGYEVRKRS